MYCDYYDVGQYKNVVYYFCRDGRVIYVPIADIKPSLEVYTYVGYPVSALLTVETTYPTTLVAELYYGSTKITKRLDLQYGLNKLYLMPALPGERPVGLSKIDLYGPRGLMASVTPKYTEVDGLAEREIYAVGAKAGFAITYGDRVYFTYPHAITPYSVKVYTVPGSLQTYLFATKSGFAYGTDAGDGIVKYGSPYVVALSGEPTGVATAAFFGLEQLPNAILSFLTSIPQQVQNVASAVADKLFDIAGAAASVASQVGTFVTSMASSAWQWANNTKIQLGPFSVSVADIAITAATMLIPAGMAAVVGRVAATALLSMGFTATAASIAARIIGAAAGAGTAYVIGRLSGEGELYALADAALTALAPFLSLTKFAGLALGTNLILAFVDSPPQVEDKEAKEKAELGTGAAVSRLCTDPALSLAPIEMCQRAAAASSVPVFAIVDVQPRTDDWKVLPGTVAVYIRNMSPVGGTAEVTIYVDGVARVKKTINMPGGGSAWIDFAVTSENKSVAVSVSYNGVEVARREFPVATYPQQQQLNMEKLVGLVGLAMAVGVISSLAKD